MFIIIKNYDTSVGNLSDECLISERDGQSRVGFELQEQAAAELGHAAAAAEDRTTAADDRAITPCFQAQANILAQREFESAANRQRELGFGRECVICGRNAGHAKTACRERIQLVVLVEYGAADMVVIESQ